MTKPVEDQPLKPPPYTMIHNYVLEHIMRDLSPNAWKVLCWTIRQTYGWADEDSPTGRKQSDIISYSQFMEATGIASRSTLTAAIRECLGRGYLLREPAGVSRGRTIYAYRLNTAYSVQNLDSGADVQVLKQDSGQRARVQKLYSIESRNCTLKSPETVLTKETNKQTNVDVVITTLTANGLTASQAERFAASLPIELIEANVAYLDTAEAKGIRSRAGWLVSQFKLSAWPPQVAAPKDADPRRFIQGKYAEYIEH